MKNCFIFLLGIFLLQSCSKREFITSPDARLVTVDTIRFDTIFTSVGSTTQYFTLLNDNTQKLRINNIKLMGGTSSSYNINIDGVSATEAANLDLAAGDSLYVFVSVTINPTVPSTPFIVEDSIQIQYNGVNRYVHLRAYGQNAHFLHKKVITEPTVWTNDLPYVITGGLNIAAQQTLTIEKGCRIYLHADAPIIVDGSLIVNGTAEERVSFQGNRLDAVYKDLPAAWPGIVFDAPSKENRLQFAVIKNAYQGLIAVSGMDEPTPKLILSETILDNIYDIALWGLNTSVTATNCLISNSGSNILLQAGGKYLFEHCTIASYGNPYIAHQSPVITVTDTDESGSSYPTEVKLRNSIIWGDHGNVADEIQVNKKGDKSFSVLLDHSLYKASQLPQWVSLQNVIINQDPAFDSINANRHFYDFHIGKKNSPALGAGIPTGYHIDLDGRERTLPPDMGCYNKH